MEHRKAEKAELRKRILKERDLLPPERRQAFDQRILERLIRYDEEKPCGAYLCYVNFRSEVSTKEFILWCLQRGKAAFVPKILEGEAFSSAGAGGFPGGQAGKRPGQASREMEFYRIFRLEDLRAGCLGILEPEGLPEDSFSFWMEKRREGRACGQDFPSAEAAPSKEAAGGSFLIRMIMPGAVFDMQGNRIGYGGGFYDRWLAKWEEKLGSGTGDRSVRLEKIALAYEMQVAEEVPAKDFDRKADLVMTEGLHLQVAAIK